MISVLVVGAAIVAGTACSDDPTGPRGGRSTTITVRNNFFTPSPDTVAAGQITFSWASGGVAHNVIWDSGPGTLPADVSPRSSGTVQVTVETGNYAYHCSLHAGMNGTIVVE